MKTLHTIRVLGRELQVRSSATQQAVREIETFVNGKVAEIGAYVSGGDSQTVAILALMNIAEEYLKLLKEREKTAPALDERVRGLIRRIAAATPRDRRSPDGDSLI